MPETGVLPGKRDQPGGSPAPGDSTWFTVTFKVLRGCPGPLPVLFTVDYAQHGQPAVARLPASPT